MEWNRNLHIQNQRVLLINGSRHYSIDNSRLPSVTAILSATKSEEDKAGIAAWKERVGHKEAERIKTEASNRGSSMHSFLEKYLLGKFNMDLLEEDNQAKKMAEKLLIKELKINYLKFGELEATLYYPNKYAGTADCIGIYEGRETIVDFKQSNKPKKEEYIEDYFLQLGAYSLAHNAVYNSRIAQGVILLCTVDNLFQDFKIEGDQLTKYQNRFLEKVEQFYHQLRKIKFDFTKN